MTPAKETFVGTGHRTRHVLLSKAAALLAIALVVALGEGPSTCWDCRTSQTATEIFRGITYGAERLAPSPEGRGLLHLVQIDLSAPGIELYVTPLDATAVASGWQYRLRWIAEVVRREKLAVAINGTLFTTHLPWPITIPGDFARGVETVVADHMVSHVWEHSYLLGFDDLLQPRLSRTKPPTSADLKAAKWGISGQGVGLRDGKVWPGSGTEPDARTAIAIDRPRRRLFLAVGELISPRRLLAALAVLGAKDGMLLDGGYSSAMGIGKDAVGIWPGSVYGGWRPVATLLGVKARPL